MIKDLVSRLKKIIFSDFAILAVVFLFVSLFALTPVGFAELLPQNNDWERECNESTCSLEEYQELHTEYTNECIAENCSLHEMHELSGGEDKTCLMFEDLNEHNFPIDEFHMGQFGCTG